MQKIIFFLDASRNDIINMLKCCVNNNNITYDELCNAFS